MSRVTRMLRALQNETKSLSKKQNDSPLAESLDLSSIERASFLVQDEYSSHGNPLHSTALEDENRPKPGHRHKASAGTQASESREKEVQALPETPKRPVRTVKRLTEQQESAVQVQKSIKSTGNQKPTEERDHTQKSQHLQRISGSTQHDGKKRAQSEVSKTKTGSRSEDSGSDTSPHTVQAESQRSISLSSESFQGSTEKRQASHVSLPRRSSSSSQPQKQKRKSSSGFAETTNLSKKQKTGSVRNPIDLDVVLEAFQEFVVQYKEKLSSNVVQKAINALSHSFEEQLTEKITAVKGFNSVKHEALKVNRTLNQKKTRLLEVKNELIKSKAELRKLEKEHSELKWRLTALTQGTAFLNNLKALNSRYLQYRSAHNEPETYGPSCMPAMLLEARSITGTENQLKNINEQLQQVLEEIARNEHCIK